MSTPKKGHLIVAEHFLSIQGEGQTMGRPSYFLRLANCNLMCGGAGTQIDGQLHNGATWRCDSIEVWRKGRELSFLQIMEEMGGPQLCLNLDFGYHFIITGGEPLMQQLNIIAFLQFLREYTVRPILVEIETNGTIMPLPALSTKVRYWNISPKLGNSGMRLELRLKPEVIEKMGEHPGTIYKMVVSDKDDLVEFMDYYWPYIIDGIEGDARKAAHRVWLMPAADNNDQLVEVSQAVAELCIEKGFNYSHRIHIAIWNKKTGV